MPASAVAPTPDTAEPEPVNGGTVEGPEFGSATEGPTFGSAGEGPPVGSTTEGRDFGPGWSSGRRGSAAADRDAPEVAAVSDFRGWRPSRPAWTRRSHAPRRWLLGRDLPRRWVDAAVVGAMLLAVAIIILGVTGADEEGSDGGSSSSPAPDVERTPQAEVGMGGASEEEGPEAGGSDAGGTPGGGEEIDLGRARTFFSAYRIAIPKSWDTTRRASFVQFTCKDRNADVRVYYEQRSGRPGEMEDELREFIKSEHPGANIGELERTRLGGADAASLTGRYGGSVETATIVAERPYLYLVVSRFDDAVSAQDRAATAAVLKSFRPA